MSDHEDSNSTFNPEQFDQVYLGDPNAYYHSLISKPLPENLTKYFFEKYKFASKDDYVAFLGSKTFVEEVGRYDYLLFFEQVLGRIVQDFHKLFAKQIYKHRAVTLAPRGIGKSDFFSVGVPIWLAYYEISHKIMVLSETDDQAKRILDEIKRLIKDKPLLKERLHVNENSKDSVWNKGEIITKNDVRIKAKSFTSRLRGWHPSTLILDDILSDQNSITSQQRAAIFKYFGETIRPLVHKRGMIQIVGTAQHKDDLLHKLGESKEYNFLKLKAFIEEAGESIWKEMLPVDELDKYKKTHGIVSFEKEYQNNPMSDNLSLFPLHVLEKCLDETISYEKEYHGAQKCFLGADFSMAGVKDGDFTVVAAAKMDKGGVLSLLNYDRFRDEPDNKEMFVDKQIETVSRYCKNFNVTLGYLEANAFQRIYAEFFKKKTNLPLRGNIVTHSGKNSLQSGIPGIRVLMENGKVKFPYKTSEDRTKTEEIIREFNGLVMSESGRINNQQGHDDIPMCLFHLIQASKEVNEMFFFKPSPTTLKKSRAHSAIGNKFRGKKRL